MSGVGGIEVDVRAIVDRLLPMPDRDLFACGHPKDSTNCALVASGLTCRMCALEGQRNQRDFRRGKISERIYRERHAPNLENIGNQRAVFFAVIRAAFDGLACPSNQALADLLCSASGSLPQHYLRVLERKGLVKITRFQKGREAHIPALGISTARFGGNRCPHWRAAAHDAAMVSA